MSVHVDVRGSGSDVVLLHGWALHGGVWGPWLDELERDATLHVVDLPGHGVSPWPAEISDLAGLAESVGACVPEGAVLLGWSLGGMVALEIARRRPARCAGLVLIATTPRFVTGDDWAHGVAPAMLEEFADRLGSDYRGTVQNFLALQTAGDEHARATLRALRQRVEERPPPAPEALTIGLSILHAADLRPSLASIAAPALVLSGERDRLTPAAAGLELATHLPDARHVLVPRAAHAPFLSHPDEVLQSVRGFLGVDVRTHRSRAHP